MSKRFGTILVPVDFSVNTDIAISTALNLAEKGACNIHLFHVEKLQLANGLKYLDSFIRTVSKREGRVRINKANERLSELKSGIGEIRKDIIVDTCVDVGEQVEKAIAGKAKQLAADLIIIGKNSHHSRLPFLNTVVPGRLAATSGIPVLTAKTGSLHTEIKTVVIPLGTYFPGRKLEVLEALKVNGSLKIRLVVFSDDKQDMSFSNQSLVNTFRILKGKSINPVSYEIVKGKNKAKSLLMYCNRVGADVLIVHPGSETRVGVLVNSHISDLLPENSRTQVLAVTPD